MISNPMSMEEVLALPASCSMPQASRALGFSASKGRQLAAAGDFPCRVVRVGSDWKVPRTGIFSVLGIEIATGAAA